MSLMDKLARKFALRWLSGRIARLRKDGSSVGKILKALDGWKLVIAFVALVGVKAWDAASNGHAGDLVGILLAMLGWAPPEWTAAAAGEAAASLLGLVAIIHKVVKAQRQARAGATASELLSGPGYVKAAIAEGEVLATDAGPALKGK